MGRSSDRVMFCSCGSAWGKLTATQCGMVVRADGWERACALDVLRVRVTGAGMQAGGEGTAQVSKHTHSSAVRC